MSSETALKKDIQKLQRAIVDGLEDVKAQDIQVFSTEHLSPLFERVVVASGTSNRQTKALAASVRDSVREAGFAKPRMEGEDNGEWIIVDCGPAVVHIMQPAIRQYYHLEDLWGDKPVRLKLGAAKPVAPVRTPAATGGAGKSGKGATKAAPGKSSRGAAAAAAGGRAAMPSANSSGKSAGKPPAKPSAKASAKAPGHASGKATGKAPGKATAKAPVKSSGKAPSKSVRVVKVQAPRPAAKKAVAGKPVAKKAAPARKKA